MCWYRCGIYLYVLLGLFIVVLFQTCHIAFHISARRTWEWQLLPNLASSDCYLWGYSHPGCEVINHHAFELYFLMINTAEHLSRCLLGTYVPCYLPRSFVPMSVVFSFCQIIIICIIWMVTNISDFHWESHLEMLVNTIEKVTKVKEFEGTQHE